MGIMRARPVARPRGRIWALIVIGQEGELDGEHACTSLRLATAIDTVIPGHFLHFTSLHPPFTLCGVTSPHRCILNISPVVDLPPRQPVIFNSGLILCHRVEPFALAPPSSSSLSPTSTSSSPTTDLHCRPPSLWYQASQFHSAAQTLRIPRRPTATSLSPV